MMNSLYSIFPFFQVCTVAPQHDFSIKEKKRLLIWVITVKIPYIKKNNSVWWTDDDEHKTNE